MLLSIQMPAWLSDFWTVYGDMITPVLVTLLTAIVTAVALKIKTDAKVNAKKADLQIQALKDVANREDNKPQLEAQSEQLKELKKSVDTLSEMYSLAFQNSNLDPEVKNNLAVIANRVKYGSDAEVIKELETQNKLLVDEITALNNKIENENKVEEVIENPTRIVRR